MRAGSRTFAAAAAVAVTAILSVGASADPASGRPGPHGAWHGHGAHHGSHHHAPAVVTSPGAATSLPPMPGPIAPNAPAPRPYGGCIPTAPNHDAYGAFVSGGC